MERLTKLLVIGWTCAALCAEIFFLRDSWRSLPLIAGLAFGTAFAATALTRRGIGAVLLFAYVYPVLIYSLIGRYFAPYAAVWIAGLAGAIVPSALTSRWHLDPRWRAPLVCWALTIVAGASIVVAREFDFNPDLIALTSVSNSSIGGWPSYVVQWTLHVAVVNLIGILWFDWLSQLSARDFRTTVIVPLAASAAVMMAVAIYQLVVDVRFLNATVYATLTRATGTVLDANVCGSVAALWIGGALLLLPRRGGWTALAAGVGVAAGWTAVWATGSRTAFAAATIVSLCGIVVPFWLGAAAQRRPTQDVRVWIGGAVLVALLVLLAVAPLRVIGPLARVRSTAPEPTIASMTAFVRQMWNRDGYGSLAGDMIRDHPWVGIGAGSYHVMLADYATLAGRPLLPPDNAQNWLRHQIVEFGLLGSIGCFAWLMVFVPFVLRRQAGEPVSAWIPRGMLIAFAFISMVGVPSQDVIAAITFWTAAFWYVATVPITSRPAPLRWSTWASVATVVMIYAGTTIAAATTTLRVPVRAQRIGWPYAHGLYAPEPDGAGGEQRWTGRRSVAVVEATGRDLSLEVAVDPLAVNPSGRGPGPLPPVDVRVWVNGAVVVRERVTDTRPIETRVALPANRPRVLIETSVSRTFRPREFGRADDRELGMLVRWRFSNGNPDAAGRVPSGPSGP